MSVLLTHRSAAAPAQVWAEWADTARWPRWDVSVAGVAPEARLRTGLRLRVTAVDGKRSRSVIRSVTEGVGYVERSRLPLARLLVTRKVVAADGAADRVADGAADGVVGGSTLTAAVSFTGLLGGLWGSFLGPRVQGAVAAGLQEAARLAERAGPG